MNNGIDPFVIVMILLFFIVILCMIAAIATEIPTSKKDYDNTIKNIRKELRKGGENKAPISPRQEPPVEQNDDSKTYMEQTIKRIVKEAIKEENERIEREDLNDKIEFMRMMD